MVGNSEVWKAVMEFASADGITQSPTANKTLRNGANQRDEDGNLTDGACRGR